MITLTRLLQTGAIALLLSACTSIDELKSTRSPTPEKTREGTVNVASRATGIDSNRVGKTTLLTINIGGIKARGDTSANIMASVREALEAAGYNQPDASFNSADAAYIHAHVEDITFGNFLFSTWGTIIVHLRLETRDNEVLWKKRIRTAINTINNYDRTAVVAMNRLVEDMTEAFVTEDFYSATVRVKRHQDFLEQDNAVVPPIDKIDEL